MRHTRRKPVAGFTLLELLVSTAVFLIIAGAALGALVYVQKNHRSHEIRVALEQRMRAAVELMIQEIGQAGLPATFADTDGSAIALTTLTAKVNADATSMSVASTSGILPLEMLTVDNGDTQEVVQVGSISGTTINLVTGSKFANPHESGRSIYAPGAYPGGVLYPQSTASTLYIFGDLDSGSRSMILAKYSCPADAGGDFTRQRFDVASGTKLDTDPVPLVNNVTTCNFQYKCYGSSSIGPADCPGDSITVVSKGTDRSLDKTYSMVTGIAFTITANSQTNDPFTGKPVPITRTFLSIQPRNIIAAAHQSRLSDKLELQPFDSTKGVFNPLP